MVVVACGGILVLIFGAIRDALLQWALLEYIPTSLSRAELQSVVSIQNIRALSKPTHQKAPDSALVISVFLGRG